MPTKRTYDGERGAKLQGMSTPSSRGGTPTMEGGLWGWESHEKRERERERKRNEGGIAKTLKTESAQREGKPMTRRLTP